MQRISLMVAGVALVVSVGVTSAAGVSAQDADRSPLLGEVDDVPVRVDPLLDDATGPQTVAVRLTAPSVAEDGSARRVQRQQDAVLAEFGSDVEYTEIARLDTVLNAIVVEVDAADIDRLAADPRVAAVSLVRDYETDLSDMVPYIGATAVQNLGLDGAGVTVAVLDSGIDYTHAAFGGEGTVSAHLAAAGAVASSPLAASRDGLFPTDRVVGGIDFVGEAWNGSSVTTLTPDDDPIDREGHGTHVADIIGGAGGVAPGVDLVAVKVCSAVGSACSGVAILQGLEYALDPNGDNDTSDRVDIVNMSLGSDYGSQFDDEMALAVDNATAAGVLSVVSAGNSGDAPYVVGAPGVAATALTVAQTAMPVVRVDTLTVTSPAEIAGAYDALRQWWSGEFAEAVSGSLQYGDGGTNVLGCTPFAEGTVTGKVVLVDRGSCDATAKVANVAAGGGLAAVIGLVAPGDPIVFSRGTGDPAVPAFVVTQATADTLKTQLATGVTVTLDPANVTEIDTSRRIASTSSRGPTLDTVTIKPEIGAPGASISAEVGTGTGTTPFGGTSGAAPVVSGSAALLLEAHPGRSPLELKATLMNTAEPVVTETDGVTPLPISRIGNGEVRVDAAVDAPVAAWSADTASGSLSFGFVEVRSTSVTLSRTVTVRNFTDVERTYTTSVAFRDPEEATSGAVTLDVPTSVTVPPSGTSDVTVTMTIDGSKLPTWNMNAESGGAVASRLTALEVDGRITLTSGEDTTRLAWHVLPRRSSAVAVEGSSLTNTGVEAGNTEVFHLMGTSPDAPDAVAGAEQPRPDLRAIGYRVVGNSSCSGLGQLEFAVETWDATTFAGIPARVSLAIDIDQNGTVDGVLRDGRLTDSSQNGTFWVPTGQASSGDFFTEFVTNSSTRIMKICLGRLGLSTTTLRSIDVTPSIADNWSTGSTTDTMPTTTVDLLGGRTYLQVDGQSVPVVSLPAGANVPFTIDADPLSESSTAGLLLVALLGGRAHEAIVAAPPTSARSLTAEAGVGQVVVSWSPPASDGGSPVTGYRVEWSTDGVDWTVFGTTSATASTVTGLSNGTAYRFRVTASNVVGDGPSAVLGGSVTPRTVPGAPSAVSGVPGNGQVVVSWSPPAFDGGSPVTGYRIQQSVAGRAWTTVVADTASTGTTRRITGLTNGVVHRFRVAAITAAGVGLPSVRSAAVVPRTAPAAPTLVTLTPGRGRLTVTWTAPTSTGGAPVTGYRIQQRTGTRSWVTVVSDTGSTTTSRVIRGLDPASAYRYRIAAINVAGVGVLSVSSAPARPL